MKRRLLTNVSNKETEGDIRLNLACFVHTRNISNIVYHKESSKFNILLFPSTVHEKILEGTHFMIIKINYSRDTKQQW